MNKEEVKHIRLDTDTGRDWVFPPFAIADDTTVRSAVKSVEGDDDSVSSWASWGIERDEEVAATQQQPESAPPDAATAADSPGPADKGFVPVTIVVSEKAEEEDEEDVIAMGFDHEQAENRRARDSCVDRLTQIMSGDASSCAGSADDGEGSSSSSLEDDDIFNVINNEKYASQHSHFISQVIKSLQARHPTIFESDEFIAEDDHHQQHLNGLVAEILGTTASPSAILKRMQGILEQRQDRFSNIANSVLVKRLLSMDASLNPPPPSASAPCLTISALPTAASTMRPLSVATVTCAPAAAPSLPPAALSVDGGSEVRAMLAKRLQAMTLSTVPCDASGNHSKVLIKSSDFFKQITAMRKAVEDQNVHWVMTQDQLYVVLCPKPAAVAGGDKHNILDVCVRVAPWLKAAIAYNIGNRFPGDVFEQRKGAAANSGLVKEADDHVVEWVNELQRTVNNPAAPNAATFSELVQKINGAYRMSLPTGVPPKKDADAFLVKALSLKYKIRADALARTELLRIWEMCDALLKQPEDAALLTQATVEGASGSDRHAAHRLDGGVLEGDTARASAAGRGRGGRPAMANGPHGPGFSDVHVRMLLSSPADSSGLGDLFRWCQTLDQTLQRAIANPTDRVSFWESIVCPAFDQYPSCLAFLILVKILSLPVSRPLRLLLNAHDPIFALTLDITQTQLAQLPISMEIDTLTSMLFNSSRSQSLLTHRYDAVALQKSVLPFKVRCTKRAFGQIRLEAPPAPRAFTAYMASAGAPSLCPSRAGEVDACADGAELQRDQALRWSTLARMCFRRCKSFFGATA